MTSKENGLINNILKQSVAELEKKGCKEKILEKKLIKKTLDKIHTNNKPYKRSILEHLQTP